MNGTATFSKLFTVDEANDILRAIRPDVELLLSTFAEIRNEIEQAVQEAGVPAGSADLPRHLESRGVAPRLFERVKEIIERIQSKGCLVNGPEAGLIDFPCLFNSEIVFLCWKMGDPAIGYWHRIPDGFAGRRPLLDETEGDAGVGVH